MTANTRSPNGWRIAGWSALLAVLALPALAMQLTDDVQWGPGDFLVIGAMLALLGLGVELALSKLATTRARVFAVAAMVALFLLVWAELAVGLFD